LEKTGTASSGEKELHLVPGTGSAHGGTQLNLNPFVKPEMSTPTKRAGVVVSLPETGHFDLAKLDISQATRSTP